MKYMGSKNRIAKHILPIILKDRKEGQWYVEPFVGGANMIDKVDGYRIGSDTNMYLIRALELIRDDVYSIPEIITEDYYMELRDKKEVDGITGFTAFAMSFGGKFFGGYRRDVAGTKGCLDNMKTQTRRSRENAIKQSGNIQGVALATANYNSLEIPDYSIIYCDPPYENTTGYKDSFNHAEFWQWCRDSKAQGHTIFISEYNAPEDFTCVWQKAVNSSLTKNTGAKKATEKLFTL